jgi:hypothetical protein
MSLATSEPKDGTEAAAPTLVVALRAAELSLCSYDDRPSIPVGWPEVLLLEGLTQRGQRAADDVVDDVVGTTGSDARALRDLLAELRARDLLPAAGAPVLTTTETPSPAPAPADDAEFRAVTPQVFRLTSAGFEMLDHTGTVVVRLSAVELEATTQFRATSSVAAARERHRRACGELALAENAFASLIVRLVTGGAVAEASASVAEGRENRDARLIYGYYMSLTRAVDEACSAHESAERMREARTGTSRVRVVPMDDRGNPTPLALGMILAYARAHKDGMLGDHYQILPKWLTRPEAPLGGSDRPGLFFFSNYIWSHGHNLSLSEAVKRESPFSVTVHGGPDTPKYAADAEAYFRENPHVDIAVHGEGEVTTAEMLEALIGAVGDGPPDLAALHDVPGLSFRLGDQIVRTSDRPRLEDLDAIPSPFLTGLFDVHASAGTSMAIIETNRGCPYGCTFCDWGSATLSRIRKFDLQRVHDELEWCAQRGIARVFVADANFGIMERDVEIAEMVAELKARYGYPTLFSTNYAKNTTKHLKQIVQTLGDAGILIQGLLSLQSMDEGVLKTVKRSNIKTEKYDELAHEFRRAQLPLFVDLMLGLPGATKDSFRRDLQNCVDREVTAKIYPTELLVNSPMNEPGYRSLHRIETSAPLGSLVRESRTADGDTRRALVVSTASFSRADYDEMLQLRRTFIVSDNLGAIRQVSRFVRQESGIAEVDLYERLRDDARARPDLWPALAFTFRVVPFLGTPPVSWSLLIEELRRYATEVLGLREDSALGTALRVQHALLPTRGRTFPESLALDHDYVAWHRAMVDVKDSGHADWETRVPRLGEYGPGTFVVDDPHDVCGRALGTEIDENGHASWELASPVARAVSHEHMWDA